jgi:adenine-specific DNA-methyltransferase
MGTKPTKAKNTSDHRQAKQGLDRVTDYRFDKVKRKNNPPAQIAAEGTVPLMAKIPYEYSPRLAPELRFDLSGRPDKLPPLLLEAQRRPLTAAEAKELGLALRNQEPWLEWAGKREKRGFEVDPVVLHIHERVSPQAILKVAARQDIERSLFADPQQQYHEAVQFYRHQIPWTNRLILGDSLQVMTSLSRREELAGKVQMIYMDPPYGIRFASNFQPEVNNRDVKEKVAVGIRITPYPRTDPDIRNCRIKCAATHLMREICSYSSE